jgi:hypothetical protein
VGSFWPSTDFRMGSGMAAPGIYPHGAGESETPVLAESPLESDGESVLGGDVRPWINVLGCAAK